MRHPGVAIEVQVLELLRNRKYFSRFHRVLKKEFFTSPSTQWVFTAIEKQFEGNRQDQVLRSSVAGYINLKCSNEDERTEALAVLGRMKKAATRIDEIVVSDLALEWVKKCMTKQALYEGMEALASTNGFHIEGIRDKLEDAIRLSIKTQESYDYAYTYGDRLQQDVMIAPIPTGLREFDSILSGGLDVGELGIFMGPTHRGKTRALVNLGAYAFQLGKKVVYIIVCDSTAKRIARRFDTTLTRTPFDVIQHRPITLSRTLKEIEERGGKLILKEFDKHAPTPIDIRLYLKELIQSGLKPDLVVLDYLDEVRSPRQYKELRHESREVTSTLRTMAAELEVPLWTASQGNRGSHHKRNVDLDDVAEDIWKVNVADVVVTLNQTDEEKEERMIRYNMVKARRENFSPRTIYLSIDPSGYLEETEAGMM